MQNNGEQVKELVEQLALHTGNSKEYIMTVMRECHQERGTVDLEVLEQRLKLPAGLLTTPVRVVRIIEEQEPLEVAPLLMKIIDGAPIRNLYSFLALVRESIEEYPDWDFLRDIERMSMEEIDRQRKKPHAIGSSEGLGVTNESLI